MEKTPKYNKKKCKKCKYHGERLSVAMDGQNIYCDYLCITGKTCLTYDNKGKVIDRRGNDADNCALFEKGAAIQDKKVVGQWT